MLLLVYGCRLSTINYKHINEILKKISKLRNAMEHSYIKILAIYEEDVDVERNVEKLSYEISFDDFEQLTLELLKYARESIILLIFTLTENETLKNSQNMKDKMIATMTISEYIYDWKMIF